MKVLIVEDNRNTSHPLKLFFEMNDHKADIVEYADEAIQRLREYDSIVVGIQLRGPNGIRDADKESGIRVIEAAAEASIPVIVLTGSLDIRGPVWKKLTEKHHIAEEDIYFKPTEPRVILERLKEAVSSANEEESAKEEWNAKESEGREIT